MIEEIDLLKEEYKPTPVTLDEFITVLQESKEKFNCNGDVKIGECKDVTNMMNALENTENQPYYYKQAMKYEITLITTHIIPKKNSE